MRGPFLCVKFPLKLWALCQEPPSIDGGGDEAGKWGGGAEERRDGMGGETKRAG